MSSWLFPKEDRAGGAGLIGAQTAPSPVRSPVEEAKAMAAVISRHWPMVRGGMFGGVTLNTMSDLHRAAREINMTPEDLNKALSDAQMWNFPGQAQNAGQAQQGPALCQFTICFAGGRAGPDPARLLQERLRVDGGGGGGIPATKLRNVHIYVGVDKTVAIAFKESSEHVVFEDETNMFPSDKLVAAFHLLLKAT